MSTSFHHQPQTNTYLGLHSYILFPGQLLHHPARPLCLSPPEVVLAVPTSVLVPLLHCLRHLIPLFLPFLLSYSLTLLLFFFLPNLVTKIRVLASPCPPRGWLSDFLYLSFFFVVSFFCPVPRLDTLVTPTPTARIIIERLVFLGRTRSHILRVRSTLSAHSLQPY